MEESLKKDELKKINEGLLRIINVEIAENPPGKSDTVLLSFFFAFKFIKK
jgi:hypothetical protein